MIAQFILCCSCLSQIHAILLLVVRHRLMDFFQCSVYSKVIIYPSIHVDIHIRYFVTYI